MKRVRNKKSNWVNKWEKGDLAYVNGYTQIQIDQEDKRQSHLWVIYLEASANHKVGERFLLNKRNIYPRPRNGHRNLQGES